MTDKEKILQYLEYKGISKNKFYVKTGLSVGFLDKGNSLGLDKLKIIIDNYPDLNIDWLLHDRGEMIKNNNIVEEQRAGYNNTKHEATPITAGHVKYIPLVSQYAQAGYLSGFDNPVFMETLPTIPIIIPTDQEPKGEYVCFEVSGDSMISEEDPSESLFERDLLICRNVEQTYWLSKLHINKWDFVIVHKTEGIIVKRIVDHDVEKKQITIHSLNPMYEDRVLSLGDISQILNVVFIHRQMRR